MASLGVLKPRPISLYQRFSLVTTFFPPVYYDMRITFRQLPGIKETDHELWRFGRFVVSDKPSRSINAEKKLSCCSRPLSAVGHTWASAMVLVLGSLSAVSKERHNFHGVLIPAAPILPKPLLCSSSAYPVSAQFSDIYRKLFVYFTAQTDRMKL